MKVAIGIPWFHSLPGQTVASLFPMVMTTHVRETLCDVFMCGHNLVNVARETIVTEALNAGATHLLFVDADMVVPHNLVDRLAKHAKPVVAATYYMREPPHGPVACHYSKDTWGPIAREEARGPSLLKVWGVGMGACLINAHVLRTLRGGEGKPLFEFYRPAGEDMFFARRCAEAGIPIYLDRDTVCGHVGTQIVDENTGI